MSSLHPEKGLIFRIMHIANLPWILDHGLHCRNTAERDPNYVEIGHPELIEKRTHRQVPIPPGVLSDYIPFYFTPHSPMLLSIKTGFQGLTKRPMSEIVIVVTSLPVLARQGIPFVFTDRHAYLQMASFYCDLARLDCIPALNLTRTRNRSSIASTKSSSQIQALGLNGKKLCAVSANESASELRIEIPRDARKELARLPTQFKPRWREPSRIGRKLGASQFLGGHFEVDGIKGVDERKLCSGRAL